MQNLSSSFDICICVCVKWICFLGFCLVKASCDHTHAQMSSSSSITSNFQLPISNQQNASDWSKKMLIVSNNLLDVRRYILNTFIYAQHFTDCNILDNHFAATSKYERPTECPICYTQDFPLYALKDCEHYLCIACYAQLFQMVEDDNGDVCLPCCPFCRHDMTLEYYQVMHMHLIQSNLKFISDSAIDIESHLDNAEASKREKKYAFAFVVHTFLNSENASRSVLASFFSKLVKEVMYTIEDQFYTNVFFNAFLFQSKFTRIVYELAYTAFVKHRCVITAFSSFICPSIVVSTLCFVPLPKSSKPQLQLKV